MADRIIVVREDKLDFRKVEWGLTKGLVGGDSEAISENVAVFLTEYLPGYAHKAHTHPEEEEIIIVLSGKGFSESKTGKQEISKGSVVYVPANVEHATYNPYAEKMRAIIIKNIPQKA